jgi:hypothetical protein
MLSFADDARGPLSDLDEQHRREYKLIQHFLFLADGVGLSTRATRSISACRRTRALFSTRWIASSTTERAACRRTTTSSKR